MIPFFFLFWLLITGCTSTQPPSATALCRLQLVDQQGKVLTITKKEELAKYAQLDILSAQPYQRIHRVYLNQKTKNPTHSKENHGQIASYYPSGQIYQLLPFKNQRAHGRYLQWHPSGELKLDVLVMGGTPDLSEEAFATWNFEGVATVFYPNGTVASHIPYSTGLINGEAKEYFSNSILNKSSAYQASLLDGISSTYGINGTILSQEIYEKNRLLQATYYDSTHTPFVGVVDGNGWKLTLSDGEGVFEQIVQGDTEGIMSLFHLPDSPTWKIESSRSAPSLEGKGVYLKRCLAKYQGENSGLETFYYPNGKKQLTLEWFQGMLQGATRSWSPQGELQSIRTFFNNYLDGLSMAYYDDGQLMLLEEYQKDHLVKGSYYQKGDATIPIALVYEGKGTAYIYTSSGQLADKISYEEGLPVKR